MVHYNAQRGFHDPLDSFRSDIERLEYMQGRKDVWCVQASKALTSFFRDLPRVQWTSPEVQEALQQWDGLTESHLKDFVPISLSSSLYHHTRAHMPPSDAWLDSWYAASCKRIGGFDAQGLSNSLYAHAMLGMVPPRVWLDDWHAASQKRISEFTPQNLCNSLYGLAVAHILGADTQKTAYELVQAWQKKGNDIAQCDYRSVSQFYLASRVFGWDVAPEIREAAKNMLRDVGYSSNERNMERVLETYGDQQKEVCGGMRIIGFAREAQHPLTFSASDLCVMLRDKQGKRHELYLEIDGVGHFVRNASGDLQPNGSTLMRNHLMQRWAQQTGGGFAVIYGLPKNAGKDVLAAALEKAIGEALNEKQKLPDGMVSFLEPEGKIKNVPVQGCTVGE